MPLIDYVSGRKMTMCILPNPWIDMDHASAEKNIIKEMWKIIANKNILMLLGQYMQAKVCMQHWCPQTHPNWPVCLEKSVLVTPFPVRTCKQQSVKFLAQRFIVHWEWRHRLDLAAAAVNVLSCVTLHCFSADSSGKRWGFYSSAVPVEVSLI